MANDIPVQGLTEMRKALLEFPKKIQKRALDKAMLAGARVIAAEARKLAPVRRSNTWEGGRSGGVRRPAGGIKRNIVAKRGQKRYANGADSYYIIGVRHGKTNTNATTARGKRRKVTKYDLGRDDPFYWRFQNLGYKAGGRWIPPKRFMERGFAAGTPRALDRFREVMTGEIAKVTK